MIPHQCLSASLQVPEGLGEFETGRWELVDQSVQMLLLMREGEGGDKYVMAF